MKTLIKNVIAVLAFMILGHFAVTAQVTVEDGTYLITTIDNSDTATHAIILDAATGRVFVGFRGADSTFKSGTIQVKDNCTDEVRSVDYTNYSSYGEGNLIIQITDNPKEIVVFLRDNVTLSSVTSSTGKVIEANLGSTSLRVYELADQVCPDCEFVKPDCKYTKL